MGSDILLAASIVATAAGADLLIAIWGSPKARHLASLGLVQLRPRRHARPRWPETAVIARALVPAPVLALRAATPGPDGTAPLPPYVPAVDTPTAFLPTIEAAQMSDEDTGAEHWGDLLAQMKTEDRVIIHAETYRLHYELRAVTDPLLEAFNRTIDAILTQWEAGADRTSLGSQDAVTA